MTWLLWRQHRAQAAVAGVAFALYAILLWITGVHMAGTYHSALAVCRPQGTCDSLDLFKGDGAIIDVVNLSVVVPLLMGLFWGVTLIGREIEVGTNTLVWMQGVRRRVWLRDKVTLLLLAAALWGGAVSAIVTWWSGTLNSLYGDRFSPSKFDIQGVMPIAYAILAVALGLAAGTFFRRVLPAFAATVVLFVAIRVIFTNYVRPYYLTARLLAGGLSGDDGLPSGSWVLSRTMAVHGRPLPDKLELPRNCLGAASRQASDACLQRLGYGSVTKYQPASRYWPFQFIEAGIFLAMAALLVAAAIFVLRRRDA